MRVHKSTFVVFMSLLLFAAVAVACAPEPAAAPTVEIAPASTEMPGSTVTVEPTATMTVVTPTAPAATAAAPVATSSSQAQPNVGVNPSANGKQIERKPNELRAAWVHDNSLATPEKIDEIVRRAELGHINVLIANVFEQGMVFFDSPLASKHPLVQGDFNPLAYLVEQAHRRGIQVHGWFVNGPVEYKGQSKIIAQHPDWAIVGPDGKQRAWLNFQRADVRQFIGDLAWEVVSRYNADGVFFDFTRYPGPEWGFDAYSIGNFNSSHDFNLEDLRYAGLPAFGHFEGTPVTQPSTAQVLATFSNGTPAVTLNNAGQGKVIVLNWRASGREIAVDSEIMRRAIKLLLKDGGKVASLRPDGEPDDNAQQSLDDTASWLKDLGYPPQDVTMQQLKELAPNSVLVVSYGYDISPEGATNMANFVSRGGGVIFIDGPSRSIGLDTIRTLTGLQKRGKKMDEKTLLLPAGDNPLIPTNAKQTDLASAQARDQQWQVFRKQGVNALIQGVYQRIKAQYPKVDIAVTVTSDMEASSQKTMQDWRAWLDGKYVDFIVPRGYVEDVVELEPILADWGPEMQKYKNVTLGVSTFNGKHSQRDLKNPSDLIKEIDRARQAGSFGIVLWNLDYVNDDQLKMLASGPFK